MTVTTTILFFLSFFFIELLYFRIADRFHIVDKPNARSSHQKVTIRGGGIIFCIGMLTFFVTFNFPYPYFIGGLLLICAISFIDDIHPVSNKLRLLCHFLSVSLLFYQIGMFSLAIYLVILSFILAIGIINAINFMDGINGLTGAYSFIALATLWYINAYVVIGFVASDMLVVAMLSVGVFTVFNLRIKAKCFAGDVGSVGIAFILIFFIANLILKSGNPGYLLLFLVYGLDSVTTIIFRLVRKENIFDAHRTHFYQFLANEKRIAHPIVALSYAICQLLCNILIITINPGANLKIIWVLLLVGMVFIVLRFWAQGKKMLLG